MSCKSLSVNILTSIFYTYSSKIENKCHAYSDQVSFRWKLLMSFLKLYDCIRDFSIRMFLKRILWISNFKNYFNDKNTSIGFFFVFYENPSCFLDISAMMRGRLCR